MPNATMISRSDAEALIQEHLYGELVESPIEDSIVMRLARRLPDMPTGKAKMPVLDLLPLAYFVNGDNGQKQTSKAAWDGVFLNAEEIAVIVPIPEAVLEDTNVDIMDDVTKRVRAAIGAEFDGAVLFGKDRPANWPLGVVPIARNAGNNVAPSSPLTYDDLLGTSGVIAKVEAGGFAIDGGISSMGMRAQLRGIKDDNGNPIFKTDMQGATPYALDGAPLHFPKNGSFDTAIAQLVVGDWSQLVWAMRKDISVKILDQAVIQHPDGTIAYNLAQNDMIALRVFIRCAWALPNPVSPLNPDRVLVPFAYLEPASAQTTYTLTFTVQDGSSNAIEGARIEIGGSKLKTNSSGQAVFKLTNGTYTYKVSKDGKTSEGTKTISSSNTTQSVTLS